MIMGTIHFGYKENHQPELSKRLRGEVRALEGGKSQCQNLKRLRSDQKGDKRDLGELSGKS